MKKAILLVIIFCLSVYQNLQAQNVGDIRMFAGTFAPKGWKSCEGQLLPISQNQALYAVLGTTYGGDGKTTFALPDLRDRSASGTYAKNAPATASTIKLSEKKDTKTQGTGAEQPNKLGLIYIIAVNATPEMPILGEVRAFAGGYTPRDWMPCMGQLLPISNHVALYSLVNTTYGGDGKITFALPDLRDRAVAGVTLENTAGMTNPIKLGEKRGIKQVDNATPVPHKFGMIYMIATYGEFPRREE